MQHLTEILASFVYRLNYGMLPSNVVETTKLYILDWYAAAFAGMKTNDRFNRAVLEIVSGGVSLDNGGASVLLNDISVNECEAAFMNAVYAHGADMDDGNRKAMGHIGAHVMSTVFAVAESLRKKEGRTVSGEEVITAVNAGYEIFNRVAAAAQPGLVKRGFHSTGTAGAIACAAASGKLIGLSESEIYDAMSVAAVQSSGLIIIAESGQSCKPLNPANAAKLGIFSARLAQKGIRAPRYPLESEKGWLHAMTEAPEERRVTEDLGKLFTITESYLKPYPSCRHTHCPIEAALKLRQRIIGEYGELRADLIRAVNVYTYANAIRIAGRITVPETDEDTKFSIHYALARTLENGGFGLGDLSVSVLTEETKKLIERIELFEDPRMEQTDKGIRGAKVSIILSDDRIMSEAVPIPKGDAVNPMTLSDLSEKLRACSESLIDNDRRGRLTDGILTLEHSDFVSVNHYLS